MDKLSQYDCFILRHQIMSMLSRIGTDRGAFYLHLKMMQVELDAHCFIMGWLDIDGQVIDQNSDVSQNKAA